MTKEMMYGTLIFGTLMMLLIGFSVVIVLDSYTDKNRKKLFAVIITLVFVLIMQNFIEFWLMDYTNERTWRIFAAIVGYSVRPAIITLYAHLIYPKMKHIAAWCLVGVNVVMHTTAFYSPIVFYLNEHGGYKPGPLSSLALVTTCILLAYLVFLIIFKSKKEKTKAKEVLFFLFWIILIVAGILADIFFDRWKKLWVDSVTISVTVVSVLSYIWVHQRFVAEYQVNFVAEQKMRLMLSQIQPHFIYNALNVIQNMEGNPESTQNAIADFANYIRGNLAVLEGQELISFGKEMDIVRDYISIQQLRFPDRINTVYEITDDDFSVPPLSVQILVENAIKHGILVRREPGTITMKSYREKNYHVVTVIDDGVGFDTEILKDTDRVGLRAVKNRLEYYLDGTISIESKIGKGTEVTIKVPCPPQKYEFRYRFKRKRRLKNENNDR